MTRPTYFHLLLFAFVALLASSCASLETMVDNGNYEEAIRKAKKQLTGKQRKNPKVVAALEEAVNKSIERDMEKARRMTNSGEPDWPRIRSIYTSVQRRQDALRPLLPVVDKNGYEAQFRFARVDELVVRSTDNAAAQHYDQGVLALARGRAGDKLAAREAYGHFEDVTNYRRNYRDAAALSAEARDLGKVFVRVAMVNQTNGYLPRDFERELLRPDGRDLDDFWRFYDFAPAGGRTYDYTARIVIDDIAVSPERVNERTYTDEKEVRDGEEYVLDANGNVAKDTLGNDITRPRLITVRAEVLEVFQTKSVVVNGSVELVENATRRVVDRDRITAEANFENYASTFRGDRRALSDDSRRNIGNEPARFPSDADLILDAADALKPRLEARLAQSNRIL